MKSSKLDFDRLREEMVQTQLVARDIIDKRVISAMLKVPREMFVARVYKNQAYIDQPLPIPANQTISQPYVVAKMCQLLELKGDENVLDIGAGSGYQAAVLSLMVKKVTTIEIKEELVNFAKTNLKMQGLGNIEVIMADGTKGYKPNAPYDAIKSAAVTDKIPDAWKTQLSERGRIVAPVRVRGVQRLVRIVKNEGKFKRKLFDPVQFVPLLTVKKTKGGDKYG